MLTKSTLTRCLWVGFGLFVLALPWSITNLVQKHSLEKNNRTVGVVISWNDLEAFSIRENMTVASLLGQYNVEKLLGVAADLSLSAENERMLRAQRLSLVWITTKLNVPLFNNLKQRFQVGDGIISADEYAPGYPGLMPEISQLVQDKRGFFPLVEIVKSKGAASLAGTLKPDVVKTHVLPVEEMIQPSIALWTQRLLRAVRERSVRLLIIHMSPSLEFQTNIAFLNQVQNRLEKYHFQWGKPQPYMWELSGRQYRRWFAFLLACLAPILVVIFISRFNNWSPWLLFSTATLLSLVMGIVIHGVGASSNIVLGVETIRGVKLQLLIPLILCFLILLENTEWPDLLKMPLTGFHVVLFGGLGGLILFVYLMRSGNFPLFPVSNSEKSFRDGLEVLLGARPRFKEFFIGHPLMMLAISEFQAHRTKEKFLIGSRLLLWIGLIGQISIINTFTHYHTPLWFGVVRTLHGLWLGLICGWLLIHFTKTDE